MSAPVLLNLSNKLGKEINVKLFRNEFNNTRA